jgi:hypothetical protein
MLDNQNYPCRMGTAARKKQKARRSLLGFYYGFGTAG